MTELSKLKRVMEKVLPGAPHEVLLVLDGSTGQNAFEQAKQFTAATDVTALAITKLDGTAKGGVVIGISDQLKIPVKYIGVGEKMEDLLVFNRVEFVAFEGQRWKHWVSFCAWLEVRERSRHASVFGSYPNLKRILIVLSRPAK